jgi:Replication-relaxation
MAMQLSTPTSQPPPPRPGKRHLPSFHRTDHPPRFQITDRDKQILLRVYYYRLLTTQQIEALLFHNSTTTRGLKTQCQRRLQLLYHHAYLDRLQLPVLIGQGRQPFVYGLDRRGSQVVAAELGISQTDVDWHPRQNQVKDPYRLEHDQANNDLWVILDRLVQAKAVEMPYWLAQHHLNSAKLKQKLPHIFIDGVMKYKLPDSCFALLFLQYSELAHFFYEEDRGTQVQTQWQEKVIAYLDFKRSGDAETNFGCRNFRVLTKTTTPKRLANLKQWTEKAGGDAMFWFTTQERVSIWQPQRFFDPIWQVALAVGEYTITLSNPAALQPTIVYESSR